MEEAIDDEKDGDEGEYEGDEDDKKPGVETLEPGTREGERDGEDVVAPDAVGVGGAYLEDVVAAFGSNEIIEVVLLFEFMPGESFGVGALWDETVGVLDGINVAEVIDSPTDVIGTTVGGEKIEACDDEVGRQFRDLAGAVVEASDRAVDGEIEAVASVFDRHHLIATFGIGEDLASLLEMAVELDVGGVGNQPVVVVLGMEEAE